ncbi:OmpA family protein [Spirosoma sp. 209]|uniref:OmpA family protein n=1 Tax=Spirosoma sp. 209 TaxID=1955701 RepID=UPI00098D2DF4|nr:OmpA family protein [Spirosoma sp. 209]
MMITIGFRQCLSRPVFRYLARAVLTGLLTVPGADALAQGKKRMPEPLNLRDHIEYAPSVSADGQTLIFQSDRYGLFVNAYRKVPRINAEGDQQAVDDKLSAQFFGVYEAHLHPSGQWTRPEPIQSINRYDSDGMTPLIGGPSISYDGNYLFFFANFPTKPGFGREDIYYCVRQRDGWGPPVNAGPAINTSGYEGFPSISADGRRLYFVRENLTSRSREGHTCYSILVSEKGRDGQWKRPIELPPPVNLDCEKAPRIMADSRTLVYSSIKAGGMGDFDLYMSTMQADGRWSEPKNLQYINTKRSDQSVAISACGDLLYYVSDGDLYTTAIPEELRPFKLATVQGFVTDSLTGAPLPVRVVVTDVASGSVVTTVETNPADGRYTVLLPITNGYRLSVNEKEYRLMSRAVDRAAYLTCAVIPANFRLKSIRADPSALPAAGRHADDIVIVTEPPRSAATSVEPVPPPVAAPKPAEPVVERIRASQPALADTARLVLTDTVRRQPSVLTIKVFAMHIGQPLRSAVVAITSTASGKTEQFTLPDGRLEQQFTANDDLTIEVSAPGYTSIRRTLRIDVPAGGKRYEFDAELDAIRFFLTMRAVDSQTGQSVPNAQFRLAGPGNPEAQPLKTDSRTQLASVQVPAKGTYQLSALAEGYEDLSRSVTIDKAQNEVLVRLVAKPVAIVAQKADSSAIRPTPAPGPETAAASVSAVATKAFGVVEKGKRIRLNKLYFDQSSPVLRPESYAELDQLYEVLSQYPSMRIEIQGHTDNQGDFDANVQLSRDRCQSVVDYLVGKGIRKQRLRAVGRGPTEPVAPNNNEENRKKNRRVEFVLL